MSSASLKTGTMTENFVRVLFTKLLPGILIQGIEPLRDASRNKERYQSVCCRSHSARKLAKHPRNYQQTKRKRRNSYVFKTDYCGSHCIILHADSNYLCAGTS